MPIKSDSPVAQRDAVSEKPVTAEVAEPDTAESAVAESQEPTASAAEEDAGTHEVRPQDIQSTVAAIEAEQAQNKSEAAGEGQGFDATPEATPVTIETSWAHDESDLAPDPKVVWGALDNGLRFAILPHDEPPGRISLRLFVDAGSLMENESQLGLAHFIEHMAFNGTRHFAADEMVEYFQRLGMAFGADTNAHTSFDETVYKIELPENNEQMLDEGMRLLRDYADGMLLEPEEIEKERGVILSELRARDSAEYRTYVSEVEFTLPDALISQRFPIGEIEVLESAQREAFTTFYEKWYIPQRMALVAVGDVEPETIKAAISKHFASMEPPAEPPADPDLGSIGNEDLRVKLHTEPEAPVTTVSVQTVQHYEGITDDRQKRAYDMALEIANGIINRRLEKLAKTEDAPFSSGTAYAWDWLDFLKNAGIELKCRPERWAETLSVAEQEMRRALEHGFTQDEFTEISANLLNSYEQAVKSAPTRKSRAISNEIVNAISNNWVYTSPQQELALASQVIGSIGPEECRQALFQAWDGGGILVFVSGNLELENPEKTIRKAFLKSNSQPVEAQEVEVVAPFSYTSFGQPGQVVARFRHQDLGVTQYILQNNVGVNLKPTDFEADQVRVLVRFGSGTLTLPQDKPGLHIVADSSFIEGGLEAHSADEIARQFAGKTVSVSFSVDEDAFSLHGNSDKENLRNLLNLMCAYMTAPGYREEALRLVQKKLEQVYVQIHHTPQGVMGDKVARYLAGGDFRFGFPEKDVILQRDMEDVRDWLAEPLAKGVMEVSIVGDFDPENAIEAIKETFGTLPERETLKPNFLAERTVHFPDPLHDDMSPVFPYETDIPKAVVAIYWPTDDIWDIRQTRRTGILAEILSDRLRKKVREEIGEAYSPFAFQRPSDTYQDYGYLLAFIIADPAETQFLKELVLEIATDIVANGITPDELERAKKPILTQLEEWVRNNGYWLNNVVGSSQEFPERLDWAREMSDDYQSISVEDVEAMARKFLVNERAAKVLIMPESAMAMAPVEASDSETPEAE